MKFRPGQRAPGELGVLLGAEPGTGTARFAPGSTWERLRTGWAGPFMVAAGLVILGLLIIPLAGSSGLYNWSYALVDGLFAFGTGIAISWGGVPAFGQAIFFAIGGYSTALLRMHNLPAIVVLLIGVVLAGVAALVYAILTSNLPFIAFAMLSLVLAQVGYQIVYTENVFGAENGLYGIPRGSFFGVSLESNTASWWWCVGIVVVITAISFAFYRSVLGRSLRASRDDAVRAEAVGINSRRLRIGAFTAGGAICGAAGVLYAQLLGVVDPSMAYWTQSATAVVMVVIGGLGTFWGALGGGVLYEWINIEVTRFTQNVDLWIGLLLVIVVLVAPGGLVGVLVRLWRTGVRTVIQRRRRHAGA
jgi:branched-chain amino acid transport system permease protein